MSAFDLTPTSMRMARTALKWTQSDLAKAADVGVSTVADFESGARTPVANNLAALRKALEQGGIHFGPDGPEAFEISLHIMTQTTKAELRFQYTGEGVAAVEEVVRIFGAKDGDAVVIDAVQTAGPVLRAALETLVQRHGSAAPHLKKLRKVLASLHDGERFLVLPSPPASTAETVRLERYLHNLNTGGAPAEDERVDELFAQLLERYDLVYPRTDRPTYVGDASDPRTCRFCGGTAATGATFSNAAHVIAAAFGNRYLKSLDECDGCNKAFGDETEPSLIAMLDVQRVFLGTQARGGRPQLQFDNGELHHDGDKVNVGSNSVAEDGAGGFLVDMGEGAAAVPNAAYRALVKMALSIVDATTLSHLSRTVAWVRYGVDADKPLPRVASAIVNLPPDPSAQISVYVRKEPHPRLPHMIGEFRLGCFLYAFAIPFSDLDQWDLVGVFDDQDFRSVFKHYARVGRWVHQDWSRNTKVAIAPQIKFVRRQSGEK